MKKAALLLTLAATFLMPLTHSHGAASEKVEANQVKEISLVSSKSYENPFMEVELDAVVTRPDGRQLRVPAFWAGGNDWKFRYASELPGTHSWKTECKDASNAGLHGISGTIEVVPSTSDNPLYKHGPVGVSENKRHFEHVDGMPFFWLADTWWKNLCKRMTWEGFQELAADRKKKGFNAVQIVCGPYPDEGFLEPRMANEGGLPYESVKFEKVNPEYFNYTDRRIQHLVESGLAPVIVGSWGRGDCNSMQAIGLEGLKRHWRYLVARYGAYPIFWILAGEIPEETKWNQGSWAPLANYVRNIDPYHRLITCHTGHGRRGTQGDAVVIDFDMVGGNHDQNVAIQPQTVGIVSSAYSKEPPMPVLVGETCYEGHMQQGFGDTQRRMFWQSILNGAAGHTYGAAGIWHASVEGDPGCASAAFGGKKVYDWTIWKEGMNYPGATELGMAKKLLEQYPWQRFEPHPEWTAPGCSAAGIPGEVRFIYHPRGRIYDWTGTVVKNLEPGVSYSAFYFDPATGRRFDQGIIRSDTGEFKIPELPSPQDWVLVMQVQNRAKTITLPAENASPAPAISQERMQQENNAAKPDPQTVFQNPPESAKPGVWWHWMGCNVTKEGITRDLEEFKRVGIGGATIFGMADVCTPWAAHIENSPTDGLIAFTDPWWEMVRHAAAEGKRLGIDVGLHNCPGYSSTGGPWITPELSMQQIYHSQTPMEGGVAFDGVLPRPNLNPQGEIIHPMVNKKTGALERPVIPARSTYWRDIAVLAVPAEGVIAKDQMIDLTGKMDATGRLAWTPPAGKWVVYRFGHTTMGAVTQPNQWEAMGLECDKMSEEAVAFHLQHVIGQLKKHLGPLVGTGLQHILLDSYEAGKPYWTPLMPQEFAQRRGYDLKPFLPIFAQRVVGSEEEKKKFLGDMDRTIADLYRDKLFATMSRMLAQDNLRFACEPYGGPFHTNEVTPHVHRVMAEFWSHGEFGGGGANNLLNAGDGKRHNILEAEAFTGQPAYSRWSENPAGLKEVGDTAFASGINRLILHSSPLQPWGEDIRPGISMGVWGTHFGRTQTWWEPGSAWLAYLTRCQALLQWGKIAPVDFSAEGLPVRGIHRADGGTHVFFVAHAGAGGNATCQFTVEGMQPELWDPVTGTMRELSDFRFENGKTIVPLKFAPAQSWFVVFRKKAAQPQEPRPNFSELQPVAELTGPWDVRFDPKWGGPAEVKFDKLEDWTKRPEPGIRYYSGTATYRKTFDGANGTWLDLGTVNHIARVRLNGRDLGVVWTAPWGVEIPQGLLKPTGNELEIEVINVWANRLIGDEQEPPDCEWLPGHHFANQGGYLKRFPDWFVKKEPRPSKGRYCFVTWNYFTKDSPLIPSGLLGPVTISTTK